jgi:hypothetical protein
MSIKRNEKGICPHCKTQNRFETAMKNSGAGFRNVDEESIISGENDYVIKEMRMCRCSNCGKVIIFFEEQMIYPLGSARPPIPQEVPASIANDYEESCLVELYSKKAAAALARRCLQNLLHEQGIKKKDLNEEIEEAKKNLPPHLSTSIESVRVLGNFAAHPIKYENTGEIVDIEEGEAEWVIDTLEQLFDFYYVAPKKSKEKRDNLNAKLSAAGKPLLK